MFDNNTYDEDPISDFFHQSLSEEYKLKLKKTKNTFFIKSYFSLLDSYIAYNERNLNKNLILLNLKEEDFKFKYWNWKKGLSAPKFYDIIKKVSPEKLIDKNNEIAIIRNALTHDFWMYLSEEELKILSKKIKIYTKDVLKRTTPLKIFGILEKISFYDEDNQKKFKNQGEKFKEDIEKKLIPSLEEKKYILNL